VSYSLDVNILIHASNTASDLNEAANAFLEKCLSGSELIVLGYPVLLSYLRISTHPSIFPEPLSPAEALENVRNLVSVPHVRAVSEDGGFLDLFATLTAPQPASGNQVPDWHLVTILKQHDVPLIYTTDKAFPGGSHVRAVNPFLPKN